MIAYVTVGADDIARAKRFYSAFLPALGYGLSEGPEGLSFALPVAPGQVPVLPDFYVKPTFNGRPASAGNGAMVAFEAAGQEQVRTLHGAALAAGGADEGQPGFRTAYGPNFYVSYLRDPQGNKIALFSCNPDEPGRDAQGFDRRPTTLGDCKRAGGRFCVNVTGAAEWPELQGVSRSIGIGRSGICTCTGGYGT